VPVPVPVPLPEAFSPGISGTFTGRSGFSDEN